MKEIFLLKLGEIVLKGANKRQFENKLRQNVRRRPDAKPHHHRQIRRITDCGKIASYLLVKLRSLSRDTHRRYAVDESPRPGENLWNPRPGHRRHELD